MQDFNNLIQELNSKIKILESKLVSKQNDIISLRNKLEENKKHVDELNKIKHIEKRELQFLIFKLNSFLEKKHLSFFQILNEEIRGSSNLDIIRLIHKALMSLGDKL